MTELYNTTFMNNANDLSGIVIGIGQSLGKPYLIGQLMLLGFFMIFLAMSLRYRFEEVLIVDSFLTTLFAILLYYIQWVNHYTIILPFGIFMIALVIYLINGR